MQRLLRESASPQAIAAEYGLDADEVAEWKRAYLQRLQTATKGNSKRSSRKKGRRSKGAAGAGTTSGQAPVMEDISRQPVRREDAWRAKGGPAGPTAAAGGSQAADPSLGQARDGGGRETMDAGDSHLPPARAPGEAPTLGQLSEGEGLLQAGALSQSTSEISDASQNQFVRNWKKTGAGDALPKEPPRPIKVHSHEAFWTRLQNWPGVGWFLHGGRIKAAPLVSAVSILLVAAVVYLVLTDAAKHRVDVAGESDLPDSALYLQPLSREEILAAEGLIKRFFEARTLDALEPVIRSPETVLPLARAYYVKERLSPEPVSGFKYHVRADIEGMDVTLHGVILGSLGEVREVAVEHTETGSRVDWEIGAAYQPMSWREFRRTRPIQTVYFRLMLQPPSYHSEPFHDDEIYRSFRLPYPRELRVIHGYAMIGTQAELKLRELMPDDDSSRRLIVGLAFPRGNFREELVEITEIYHDGWIVDYPPGAHHFDLTADGRLSVTALSAPEVPSLPDSGDGNEEILETLPEESSAPVVPGETGEDAGANGP